MRLLALLTGISALVAALFFLIAAFQWFGDDDGVDASDINGLEAFAFCFLAIAAGLYFLDRAGVASREIIIQRREETSPYQGTDYAPSQDYRIH